MAKKRAKYPRTIRFNDGKSYAAFEKGCLVGHIVIRAGMRDEYGLNTMKCHIDIDERQIVKLQNWLARWRKSHEINNGPIIRPMVRKMVSMLVPA